jgi:hypothetical protein
MALGWRRPTLDTRFHIDLSWWQEQGRDIRVYVRDMLCDDCREMLRDYDLDDKMDAVDETTGEVVQMEPLWYCLGTCCGQKPDFIGPNTPIIEAVFRTFLLNNNTPLSIRELHERLDRRPPATLLRMLTAGDIYLGLRPIRE